MTRDSSYPSALRRMSPPRTMCGELGSEDGCDPREYFRRRPSRRGGRKLNQLCRQVQETLDLVFAGESLGTGAEGVDLCGLRVALVEPCRHGTSLHVTLVALMPSPTFDPRRVEAHLAQLEGRLRSEVAAAITRKRTPALTFRVASGAPPAAESHHPG